MDWEGCTGRSPSQVPNLDRVILATTRQMVSVIRKVRTQNGFMVARKIGYWLATAEVPEDSYPFKIATKLTRLAGIEIESYKQRPIRMERNRVNVGIMSLHSSHHFFSFEIPKRDCFVITAREQLEPHGVKFYSVNSFIMALQFKVVLLG